jgi:hypothetical protein
MNKIETTLQEKGKEWIIAAMVDGSVGYHDPEHAERLIRDYLNGIRESWCERCIACFDADLEKMILSDIEMFERLEQRDPEKTKRIIEFVQRLMKTDETTRMTVSMMYSTMAF